MFLVPKNRREKREASPMMWVANSLNPKQRERVNFGQNDDGNSASLKLPLYALPFTILGGRV